MLSPRTSARSGTDSFTVKDTKSTSTSVWFTGSQQLDIRVQDANHAPQLRQGAGLELAQMMMTRSPSAGEVFTFTAHQSRPAAGRYQARAYFAIFSYGAVAFASVESH